MSQQSVPQPQPSAIAKAAAAWGQVAVAQGALSYDPKKFYVRATDVKGHGERLAFRVPPDTYAMIMRLVGDDDFPDYQSVADFARDAIVHLVNKREAQVGEPEFREAIKEMLARYAFNEFTRQMSEDVARWESMYEETREALTDLQRAGAWGQVWSYLLRAEELADGCPEPYRTTMLDLVKEWRDKVPSEWQV